MHSRGNVSALALSTQTDPNLPDVVTGARGWGHESAWAEFTEWHTRVHIYVYLCVSWRGVHPSVPSARLCTHTHRHSRNVYCLRIEVGGWLQFDFISS